MVHRQRFLVRFWGVRGSYPTPGPNTLRHGGNTSCVEVQAGTHTLIFDAGSGIIRLGDDLIRRSNTAHNGHDGVETQEDSLNLSLLFSHAHGDHLVGFPFFAPLFDPRTRLHLFGPRLGGHEIEQLVTTLMSPPYFPVDIRKLPSQRNFHVISGDQCISWQQESGQPTIGEAQFAHTHSSNQPIVSHSDHPGVHNAKKEDGTLHVTTKYTTSHPLDGAVHYRIEYGGKRLVYATDVEWSDGIATDFLDFIEGADVLIHDAQYTPQDYHKAKHGFGHSSIEMATEAARAANVGELILFHHEPTYDDDKLDAMEADAQARFARTRSACEGMEIDLLPNGAS